MFYTSVLVDLRKEVGSVKQKRFPPNIFKSSTEKVREILHFYFYNVFLVSGSVGFVGSKTFWLPRSPGYGFAKIYSRWEISTKYCKQKRDYEKISEKT